MNRSELDHVSQWSCKESAEFDSFMSGFRYRGLENFWMGVFVGVVSVAVVMWLGGRG